LGSTRCDVLDVKRQDHLAVPPDFAQSKGTNGAGQGEVRSLLSYLNQEPAQSKLLFQLSQSVTVVRGADVGNAVGTMFPSEVYMAQGVLQFVSATVLPFPEQLRGLHHNRHVVQVMDMPIAAFSGL